tara:strand:+ start:92 stop:238 length:147 start_codon:yes stop_codon:yes gene_type:complete
MGTIIKIQKIKYMLLKKGDSGSGVKELQTLLDDNGFWNITQLQITLGI